MVKLLDTKHG